MAFHSEFLWRSGQKATDTGASHDEQVFFVGDGNFLLVWKSAVRPFTRNPFGCRWSVMGGCVLC